MAVPQVIPIACIPAYRTEFAGTWSRGQFLGNVLSLTDPVAWAVGDRINSRRCYAYLHEFDHEGNYLESTVESPGNGEEARQAAMLLLEEWIAGLPGERVGAGNYVTSCDLPIFVDQAAEAVAPQNAYIGHVGR